jgi:CHAD domain-containing protein
VDRNTPNPDRRAARLFQKLGKLTQQLLPNATPESVHQFRTTIRRLESVIATRSLQEQRNVAKLARQLATLRRRAGKVRDLDVQLAALCNIRMESGGRDKTVLAQYLASIRSKREKKLLETLEDEVANGLRKRMRRGAKLLARQSPGGQSQDFTTEALQKFWKIAADYPLLTEENFHGFRTECKRIRYLAEMSAGTREAERVVAALKRVQDAIGEWHDWLTLSNTAQEAIPNPASPLLAAIRAYRRSKFNEALRVVTEVKQQLLNKVAALERDGAGSIGQPGITHARGAILPFSRKPAESVARPSPRRASAVAV